MACCTLSKQKLPVLVKAVKAEAMGLCRLLPRWYLGLGGCLAGGSRTGAFTCGGPPAACPRGRSPSGAAAQSRAGFQGAAAKARAKLPLAGQEQAAGQRVALSAGSHANLHPNFPFFFAPLFFFPFFLDVSHL